MAVQAQYPANLSIYAQKSLLLNSQMPSFYGDGGMPLGDSQRKRIREEELLPIPLQAPNQLQYFNPSAMAAPSNGLQSRLLDSSGASTSGGLHLFDVDALLRLHNERLRLGLQQAHKRQCRALISVVEKQFAAKAQQKDLELEQLIQRNAELEERVRQLSVEKEMWFAAARNSEAIVSDLKASLEEALQLQMKRECGGGGAGECENAMAPVGDEESCCFQGEERNAVVGEGEEEVGENDEARRCTRVCVACRENEVCVLLLPCKHLCLCARCATASDACPVCTSPKNASIHVIIPTLPTLR